MSLPLSLLYPTFTPSISHMYTHATCAHKHAISVRPSPFVLLSPSLPPRAPLFLSLILSLYIWIAVLHSLLLPVFPPSLPLSLPSLSLFTPPSLSSVFISIPPSLTLLCHFYLPLPLYLLFPLTSFTVSPFVLLSLPLLSLTFLIYPPPSPCYHSSLPSPFPSPFFPLLSPSLHSPSFAPTSLPSLRQWVHVS